MKAWTTLISTRELSALLGAEDARIQSGNQTRLRPRIVDCRFSLADPEAGRRDYRDSHIPGAVYAHLDEDLSDLPNNDAARGRHPLPSVAGMESVFRSLGIDDEDQVVAYDDGGGAIAARLWWMLRFLGHERVAVLDGGWRVWLADGGAVSSDTVNVPYGDFTARPGAMPVAALAEIAAGVESGTMMLLDARDRQRYTGEEEPIDPVAGHIPGALSVPFKENIDGTGRFLSRAALKERFARFDMGEAAGEGPVARHSVVSYCGSGVTACHNILAMEHAGVRPAALFPPSWSGWISDPDRPVETGALNDRADR